MIRRLDLRGRLASGETLDYRAEIPRAGFDVAAALESSARSATACTSAARRRCSSNAGSFDGVELSGVRVPAAAADGRAATAGPDVRAALDESIAAAPVREASAAATRSPRSFPAAR